MNIKSLVETIGIDLVPYAIGWSKFTSKPSFEPAKINGILENVQNLGSKKLDEALKYSKQLLDEEDTRGEKAENKAYNLIGVTGISAAFITGISKLIPEKSYLIPPSLSIILLSICYVLIVIGLTLTVLLASRAVLVRSYTRPDIADIFLMKSMSIKQIKTNQLATYIYCYNKNEQIHNIKLSYLMGAQLWFRNSVVLFLILAFALISIFIRSEIYDNSMVVINSKTPTSTLQQSPSLIPSFATSTLKPTISYSTNTPKPDKTPTPVFTFTSTTTSTLSATSISTP